MSDLIDRHLIAELVDAHGNVHWEDIAGLPSAQPEPIKINIEDFNKEDWERLKKEWGNTPITVLPAQPEITRCKVCKYYVSSGWCEGIGTCVSSDDFCSRAERKDE